MVKEILIKVADNVLVNLQVFFGERDKTEEYLLKIGEQVYRFVEGTEENVVISSKGTVLRRYPKSYRYRTRKNYYQIVNCKTNSAGYLQVGGCSSTKNTALVHRLVAEAFLEKPENKTEIDHINRNKEDNRVENLRWVTREENMKNGSHLTPYREKVFWKDIVAINKQTGEKLLFKSPSDVVPFAEKQEWGRGWGPRLHKVLHQKGYAYGYFWSGTSYKI